MDDFGIKYPMRGLANGKGEFEQGELTFDEIESLNSPFLHNALQLYHDFKLFGLPNGKGYLNERQVVLDILSILEDESGQFDSWELEKQRS